MKWSGLQLVGCRACACDQQVPGEDFGVGACAPGEQGAPPPGSTSGNNRLLPPPPLPPPHADRPVQGWNSQFRGTNESYLAPHPRLQALGILNVLGTHCQDARGSIVHAVDLGHASALRALDALPYD